MPEANFAPHPENLESNRDIARLMAEAHRDFLEYGDPSLQNPNVPAFSPEMKHSWAQARADNIQFLVHDSIDWIFEDKTYGPPDPADPDYAENFKMAMTLVLGTLNDPRILNPNQLRLINAGIKTGEKKPKTTLDTKTHQDEGISRVLISVGRRSAPEAPADSAEVETLSPFEAMRPEPRAVKVWSSFDGRVELRQSSSPQHQDGIAYNPKTGVVAVADGMGSVGLDGDFKNNFGYALANAVAELSDITVLQDEAEISKVVERSKQILRDMGVSVEPFGQKGMSGTAGSRCEVAAALGVVQPIEGTVNEHHVVTFGDVGVVIMDEHGVVEGFGESFQMIKRGDYINSNSEEYPAIEPVHPRLSQSVKVKGTRLGSYIGIGKETLHGVVSYGRTQAGAPYEAEFRRVVLKEGQILVISSDAFVQNTAIGTLVKDAGMSGEKWRARQETMQYFTQQARGQGRSEVHTYGDDATLAIVRPGL